MTVSPSTDSMTTSETDTEPFDNVESVPAVKTSRQDSVGVGWEKPSEEEHIDGICESLLRPSRPQTVCST